jgi:hypothetical protein
MNWRKNFLVFNQPIAPQIPTINGHGLPCGSELKTGVTETRSWDVLSTDMIKVSTRFYILAFLLLFAISTAILLIASTAKTPVPAWGGYLDVGIVVLIAFSGFMVYGRNKSTPTNDISYQIALYLFPLILVGMWIYRDTLDFNILLPGVAWRTYFFLSILPHAIRLWKSESHQ